MGMAIYKSWQYQAAVCINGLFRLQLMIGLCSYIRDGVSNDTKTTFFYDRIVTIHG